MKLVSKCLGFCLLVATGLLMMNATAAAKEKTRVLSDQLGRKLVVPEHPRRVIPLAPSITEIIYALDQSRVLVGATRFSDYPDAAKRLPKVGSYIHLDLEKIIALRPDLCIAIKDGNPLKTVQHIESFDIPVYAMDPRDLNMVIETVVEMGDLLHAEEQAARLEKSMRQRIRTVRERVANIAHRPSVFFQIGVSPIVSIGNNTFINELIEMAGGHNLSGGPVPYPRFSVEQVLRLAPEVFIITSMARGEAFEVVKGRWERWPDMPAVATGRIHLVDSDIFDRATPRLVDGLEVLAHLIHPDLFEERP